MNTRDVRFKVIYCSLPDRRNININVSARVGDALGESPNTHNLCCLKSEKIFLCLLTEHGCMKKDISVKRYGKWSNEKLRDINPYWFQTFAVIWILKLFFWAISRRQIVVGRRFETLYQFHLHPTVYHQPLKTEPIQGSETSANYNLTLGKYPKEQFRCKSLLFKKIMRIYQFEWNNTDQRLNKSLLLNTKFQSITQHIIFFMFRWPCSSVYLSY